MGIGLLAITLSLAAAVMLVFRGGESALQPHSATLTKMDYAVLIQQATELQQYAEMITSETDTDWQAMGVVDGKLAVGGINTASIAAPPTYVSSYSLPVAPRGLQWKFGMLNSTTYYSPSAPAPAQIWAYLDNLTSKDCQALGTQTGGGLLTGYSLGVYPVPTTSAGVSGSVPFWLNDLQGAHAVAYMPPVLYAQPACVYQYQPPYTLRFVVLLVPPKYTNRGYIS